MQNQPLIQIKNATLAYQQQIIFENLNFILPAHQITCVLGPSGVGKTTLLRLFAGLVKPDEQINFSGEITAKDFLVDQTAYMAQTDLLLPWFNALDNALLGCRLRISCDAHDKQRARELFQQLNLKNCENKLPSQLSGGMRQRVALVRTLLEDKSVVLMDEPFSALDAMTRWQLQDLAVKVLADKTVLLVTHDPFEALRIADEIIILSGQPAQIIKTITMTSPKPRDLTSEEVRQQQSIIFATLMAGFHE